MYQKNLFLILGILGLCACNDSNSAGAAMVQNNCSIYKNLCTSIEYAPGVFFIKGSDGNALMKASEDLEAQKQQTAQFSNNHYAVLVAPGVYNMVENGKPRAFNLGYYTQVIGVGKSMEDVTINPGVEAYNQGGDPDCFKDKSNPACLTTGGLNNFWRGIENFSVEKADTDSALIFAVSQASPIRSIHFKNSDVLLCDWHTYQDGCGYTSGGFMANSIVEGAFMPGSQQQWLTRNSQYNNLDPAKHEVASWNSVFVGTTTKIPPSQSLPFPFEYNQPDNNKWNNFPVANIAQTTTSKEKPYLTCTDTCNETSGHIKWKVEVPQVRFNSIGVDDGKVTPPTELDVATKFIILSPDSGSTSLSGVTTLNESTIAAINQELNVNNKNLIITPGVYNLDGGVINITKNDTIVLGIGIPSLVCTNSTGCINVSATSGVDLAGFTLDAGYNLTPNLLQIGTKDSSGSQKNPIFLHDIYFRVAETQLDARVTGQERQTVAAAEIYTSYVVGDNLWMWRADHDKASTLQPLSLVNWGQDRAKYGLIVYGNNVTVNGLAVEHFQDYQTVWYGNNGIVNFYQSEMPYDVPSLVAWTCTDPRSGIQAPAGNGCASYMVDKNVTSHIANGLGVYTYFAKYPNPQPPRSIVAKSAFIIPTSNGINVNYLMGKWLNGDSPGGYKNLVATSVDGNTCLGYGVESKDASSQFSVLGTVNAFVAVAPCN
ncbi:MAG: hypothetical protein K0R94_1215 [Burkholderiales bacterium]|jgi:hypothetical protein|nr:hypothetical protein [Burkholderiales bacterium]